MITEYPWDPDRVSSEEQVFPDAIEGDPSVVYHGTSGSLDAQIESSGLIPTASVVSDAVIGRIIGFMEGLGWFGTGGGGYASLKGFAHDFDRSLRQTRSVYLSPFAHRCLLYATKEYAGGEAARATRICLQQLEEKVQSIPYDEVHAKEKERLAGHLRDFRSVSDVLNSLVARHGFGSVYAIRLDQSAAAHVRVHQTMGTQYELLVPATSIIGRVRVPPDYQHQMSNATLKIQEREKEFQQWIKDHGHVRPC